LGIAHWPGAKRGGVAIARVIVGHAPASASVLGIRITLMPSLSLTLRFPAPVTKRLPVVSTVHRIEHRLHIPSALHLIHVSILSGRVCPQRWGCPYPPGYGFPLPFGGRPSLLGSTQSHCGSSVPHGSTDCVFDHTDRIGVTTFRATKIRPGWVPPLRRSPLVSTSVTLLFHRPATRVLSVLPSDSSPPLQPSYGSQT
jgi:hypothetical protein